MPTLLSQRNSDWKDELLGNGSVKIGGFGCTLTCLTMLANEKNVKDSNNRGKANGLFGGDTKNLILWTQIKKTFPNLDFVYRYYSYDNDKVLKAISDYGACLVEVDFDGTSRTDDRHWVLCVGNGRIHDPWTGTIRDFSVYPIKTGFTVIKVNKQESNTESETMTDDQKGRENGNKFFNNIKNNINAKETPQDIAIWLQNDIDNVSNEINQCYKDKNSLAIEVSDKKTQISELQTQIASLNTKAEQDKADFEALEAVNSGLNAQITSLSGKVATLTAENKVLSEKEPETVTIEKEVEKIVEKDYTSSELISKLIVKLIQKLQVNLIKLKKLLNL